MNRLSEETFNVLDQYIHLQYAVAKTQEEKDAWHSRMNEIRLCAGKEPTAPV